MIDPFALLDEPRRPWLHPESLKAKFVSLSADVHPDRMPAASEHEKKAANERFAELNAAYHRLQEPKARLQTLLELERGAPPAQIQSVGQNYVALFSQVSELCRKADSYIEASAKETSPLLRVRSLETSEELTGNLKEVQKTLDRLKEALNDELRQLNRVWESAPPVGSTDRIDMLPCQRLEEIYRDFGYLKRWTDQLQERVFGLSIHLNNLLQ